MRTARDEMLILLMFLLIGGISLAFFGPDGGSTILIFIAILLAVYSVYTNSLSKKLYSYVWQSSALVPLAALRFLATTDPFFLGVAAFLAIRVFLIPVLMTFATVRRETLAEDHNSILGQPLLRSNGRMRDLYYRYRSRYRLAQEYWRVYGETQVGSVMSLVASAAFIVLSFLVAQFIKLPSPVSGAHVGPAALGAPLSLLLIGLFAMVNEQELPSQIVGLLIMENGLFLAAAIFVTNVAFLVAFWFSMATFFLITFAILARFVPDLHSISKSARIERQKSLAELQDPSIIN